MARRLSRGDIWLLDRTAVGQAPSRRRPVPSILDPGPSHGHGGRGHVYVSRRAHGDRGGVEEGLKATSCVNLCNVFTVRQSELARFVGTVGTAKMHAICRALAIACDCD